MGLTEVGARFVERLRPAIEDVRSSFDALAELRDRPAGKLRLNVPRVAYRDVLEPMFARFLTEHPDIELELAIDDGLTDIVEHGFDAGIRLGETLDREMIAVRVSGEQRVAVVGAPAYFKKRGKPKHPRELHAHECINYRRITGKSVYNWEFTENGRDFEIAVNGRLITNDPDVLVRAAVDGVGVAHVLEAQVTRELKEKQLVRVLDAFCPPFPGYFLYYPSRRHVAPKLTALVGFLRRSWRASASKPADDRSARRTAVRVP